jgi:hypothetical protein
MRLERRYQRPLLGSGLRDFLVSGELEVGEVVGVEVIVVEVHVLLLVVVGVGALRRSSSWSSPLRHVVARAVSRTPCSSTRASRSAAYTAVSSVSKSFLAAISAARSSSG